MTSLNLHGNCLQKIEKLTELINLKNLNLSFNQITKIEGLNSLIQLEVLDLSYNFISKIDLSSLKGLTSLTSLDLACNRISNPKDLNTLKKSTPQLVHLNLMHNFVCDLKGYRGIVLRRFHKLQVLDLKAVILAEIQEAQESSSSITFKMLQEHSVKDSKLRGRLTDVANIEPNNNPSKFTPFKHPEEIAQQRLLEQISEIDLSHQGVYKIQNIDRLINLQKAAFYDNQISKIEGLDRNLSLQELFLAQNSIQRIENLSGLLYLTCLDLSKNQITKIEGLEKLNHLSQLYLDDNDIDKFDGLESLVNLGELCKFQMNF